jgi:hypothetical protein
MNVREIKGVHSATPYSKLFNSYQRIPTLACIVFFLIACFILFQIENYWLAALVAAPPTAAILTLWVIRGRELDRWVCPQCGRPMPKERRILPRLDPPERCPSCKNPIG